MVDYCQVISQLRQITQDRVSEFIQGTSRHARFVQSLWYNISRDILSQQLNEYNLDGSPRQITKDDVEQMSISLLNRVNTSMDSSNDHVETFILVLLSHAQEDGLSTIVSIVHFQADGLDQTWTMVVARARLSRLSLHLYRSAPVQTEYASHLSFVHVHRLEPSVVLSSRPCTSRPSKP